MSEVVPIRQGLTPEPTAGSVDQGIVKELENLLGRAKAGEITGMAFVALCPGDFTTYSSVGRLTRGVIGALALLQHQLMKNDIEELQE